MKGKICLKRTTSLVIVIIMLIGLLPTGFMSAFEAQAAENTEDAKLILDTDNKITRAQWLHNLAVVFNMSVEDNAYPDNYFSDLENTHEYYYDILLNVNFGVIDIAAGGKIEPDEKLNRAFAAKTLNYCLGFQLENESYTFSDASTCENPSDAQVAINRKWFFLINKKFCPDSAVTDSEVKKMITDAKDILASRIVDENYNSKYKFDRSVIEIPDGTDISVNDNTVQIIGCPKIIKKGDKFAAYQCGIPKIYEAVAVSTSDTVTNVTVNPDFDGSDLFLSIDAQGVADASGFDIIPDENTTITVDEIEQSQPAATSIKKKAKAAVNLKRKYKFNTSIDFGDGVSVKCEISMENPKVEYSISTGPVNAHVVFVGTATVSFNGGFDMAKAAGVNSIPLGEIGIPGIGGLKLCVDLSLAGAIGASTEGRLRLGFNYSDVSGFSVERNFEAKSFCLTATANASAGISVKFGIDTPVAEAAVFFKAGGTAAFSSDIYADGKKPMECANFSAYLYCSYGINAAIKIGAVKKSYEKSFTVWDVKSSPVKIARHYEDGKEVADCSRGGIIGYFTPWNSIYGSSGWADGFGSIGYDRSGKPVVLYEYELDAFGRAIITKYNGNVTSLYIPSIIDGYAVETLGNAAFANNKMLRTVRIPDAVTKIGDSCFNGCSNLSSVNLPLKLVTIECLAFGNCMSLFSINLPKSLKEAKTFNGFGGEVTAFSGCKNLSRIEFEPGITEIPDKVFAYCTGIKTLNIPNSVKSIGNESFKFCTGLTELNIPESVITIGRSSFLGCTELSKVVFPDTVTDIGNSAFQNCQNISNITFSYNLTTIGDCAFNNTNISSVEMFDHVKSVGAGAFMDCKNLSSVRLSKALETIGAFAFGYCEKLIGIEIPKSLKKTTEAYFPSHMYDYQFGVFIGSNNLKNVTFEKGITQIANGLFSKSFGLDEIIIPDTVTSIGANAFQYCSRLKKITLSKSLISIGADAFTETPIQEIDIPDNVREIGSGAFMGCKSLSSVKLSQNIERIDAYAFGYCESLTEISIPRSLKTSASAYYPKRMYDYQGGIFIGSNNLRSVTFEDGTTTIINHLFRYAGGLEKIVIPDTVTTIKEAAFQNCTNLKEVTLSKKLEKTEGYIFDGCSAIESISIPDTVSVVGDGMFRNCTLLVSVELSNKITSITKNMFQNCTSLKNIEIPKTVQKINQEAFRNCDSLESIVIPDSVKYIDNWAFAESEKLKGIQLNFGLDGIGYNTFRDCDSLESIKIPDSVTTLGDNCFYDCDKLREVELSFMLKEIQKGVFEHCDTLESLIVPYSVTRIRDNAFKNCIKLKEITIPKKTTDISTSAFSYKDRLTIFGVSGSVAENFAKNNDYKFVAKETPADGVSVPERLTMNKGAKIRLVPNITPKDFTDDIVWKTGDKNIAAVDETGLISAVSVGTTKIKLCVGEITVNCEVTVVQPVTSISMRESLSLEAGEVKNIDAEARPSNAQNRKLNYCSSDPSVASVDDNGNVTGYKKGKAVITVTAADGNGAKKTCDITVLNTCYEISDINLFESPHNYPNNCLDVWSYSVPDAGKLNVTFDERTCVEDGFDYIKIYDINNNELGSFTGAELAGKTITVTGDTVKVKLISDKGGTEWGFKVKSVVPVSPCTNHIFEDTSVPPTCTENGYVIHTCSVCGYSYKDIVQPLKHDIKKMSAKAPTCTEKGNKAYVTCSRCEYTTYEETEPLDHIEEEIPAVAANCVHTGLTEGKKCIRCNEILVEQQEIAKTAHTWDNGTVTREPQVGVAGERTFTCTVCGATRTEEIAPLVPSVPDRIEVKSSDSAKELNDGIVGATHSVTVSELLASSNASYIVDKDGNRITETTNPLATGMKIILESGGERLEKVISVLGDVNGDGEISVSDARGALRAAVGLDTLEGAYLNAARVNGADEVAVSDARSILRAAVALDTGKDWLAKIK